MRLSGDWKCGAFSEEVRYEFRVAAYLNYGSEFQENGTGGAIIPTDGSVTDVVVQRHSLEWRLYRIRSIHRNDNLDLTHYLHLISYRLHEMQYISILRAMIVRRGIGMQTRAHNNRGPAEGRCESGYMGDGCGGNIY